MQSTLILKTYQKTLQALVSDIDLISSFGGSESVKESERITDQFAQILHTARDHGLNPPTSNLKTVEAGVLVGEGGAHPRLHVAHLELERVPPQLLQLRQRLANLIRGVPEILNTIPKRRSFPFTHRCSSGFQAGGPDGNVACINEAHLNGRIHQIALRGLQRRRVGRERRNADLRIQSYIARSSDKFHIVRVPVHGIQALRCGR